MEEGGRVKRGGWKDRQLARDAHVPGSWLWSSHPPSCLALPVQPDCEDGGLPPIGNLSLEKANAARKSGVPPNYLGQNGVGSLVASNSTKRAGAVQHGKQLVGQGSQAKLVKANVNAGNAVRGKSFVKPYSLRHISKDQA
jgi:hypothetical protein